jgi:hypothetical protein
MSDGAFGPGMQVNRGMVVGGAVLVGLGGLLGFSGMVLLGSALVTASRRWMRQLDRPPTETARRKWEQARAATTAGAEAWRSGSPDKAPAKSPAS